MWAAAKSLMVRFAVVGIKRGERREGLGQSLDQIARAGPVLVPQPLHGRVLALAFELHAFGAFERCGDARKAAAEIGRAEGCKFERAAEAAHVERRKPQAAQRMLQQRHHLGWREILRHRVDHEIEEGARHGLGEGTARAVVDANAPALQADRDAARQQSIGRDERCRASRHLDGFAQDQRDGFGFVGRARRFDQRHARQARRRSRRGWRRP